MRLNIEISLQKPVLPLDHRRAFISLIKLGLTKLGGSELVDRYYGKAEQKPFTFALFLPGAVFGEEITLSSPVIHFNISTNDYRCFGDMSNAMNRLRSIDVEVCGIKMCVSGISLGRETPVTSEEIGIKLLSPLVIRKRDAVENTDKYYTVEDDCFEEALCASVAAQLRMLGMDDRPAETLRVTDSSRARRTVTSHFGRRFGVTVGFLSISGDKELLELLSLVGLGSQRSSGFGMFDIVSQEVNTGG